MAKKPAAKVAKPEVTLEQLVAVAEDFNTFMFTDGEAGIDLELNQEYMLKEITELCIDLVGTDTVTAETAATLALLGIACPAAVSDEAGEEVGEDVNADDEPAKDDNDTGETDAQLAADLALVKKSTKIDKIREIAKLYNIVCPPPFLKDLAKLKTYVVGKLDGSAPAKAKAEKGSPKPPKTPTEKTNRYTRGSAFADAILSDKELMKNPEKLSAKANELYIKSGGKDNLKETHVWWTMKILPVLIKLGY